MPFVKPGLLGSSIFLYGSERDATDGANWGGSGVLIGIPSQTNPSRTHLYAVSNDHVIHSCPVIRLTRTDGNPYVLPGTDADWLPHPDGDDVAIRSLGAVVGGHVWYVPADLLLSLSDLNPDDYPWQISPGDDCLMVGRYINQEFRQFDRPVVRFGNLAMLPEHVYQDKRSFDQESFLVDMRSHAGFSGSPVFVYYEESGWRWLPPAPEEPPPREEPPPHEYPPLPESLPHEDKIKAINATSDERVRELEEWGAAREKVLSDYRDALQQRVVDRHVSGLMGMTWLLGIDWGHLPVWDDVFDATGRKTGMRLRVNSGMAGVVPAWKLTDLLNDEDIAMARDKAEKQLSEMDEGAAILDASEPDEFAQFADLTQKLVQVPKRELDEKRKDKS